MSFDDPNTWLQGANAFKAIFEGLRTAIGLVRDASSSGGDSQEQSIAIIFFCRTLSAPNFVVNKLNRLRLRAWA
jgi:hypothetical protein